MRGNNTRSGADGKTQATAFVFPYPYTAAAKLWFKVTVVVGGTRSAASATRGPVIMGAWVQSGAGLCLSAHPPVQAAHARTLAWGCCDAVNRLPRQ